MTNSLESLIDYCIDRDRICPEARRWYELHQMLLQHRRRPLSTSLKSALILGGSDASNGDKIMRLQHHFRWAESHGCLPQADAFLRGLPEDEWHHVGE